MSTSSDHGFEELEAFEGFDLRDYEALLASARGCWQGPWTRPEDSPTPTPIEWLRRLGAAHPALRERISDVLCELLLEPQGGLAFAASTILAQADWDHRGAVDRFARTKWSALGGLDSTVFADSSRRRDIAQILVASPSRAQISSELAGLFRGVTSEADGFPWSLLLAGNLGFDRLSAVLADAERALFEELLMSVLGWAVGSHEEALFTHFGRGSGDFRARVGAWVKGELERAAQRAAAGAEDLDLPEHLRELLGEAAGTHAKRWQRIASYLDVRATPFR